MRHCYIDFGEELFRAFQCGDWEKEDNVETAINAVLKGVKAIYAGNSVRQAFEVIIEHGDKLVLEKHGKVAHIRWAMECQ